MRVVVRLFAVCKDRVGASEVEVEVLDNPVNVASLLQALGRQEPKLAPLLSIVRVAVNQSFASPDMIVSEDDEVVLIPPVSGGSGVCLAEIRETEITLAEVEQAVAAPGAGAIVSFVGAVRNRTGSHEVTALEYEAYKPMAERVLRTIASEVCASCDGARVAVLHRIGRLNVGEMAVAISVSTPHRADAFDGCRHVIERIKQDVPVWKKEVRLDGSTWVGVGS